MNEPFTCTLVASDKPIPHTFTPVDNHRWRVTRENSVWECYVEPDRNSCTCTAGQYHSGCSHLRALRRHFHDLAAPV